MIPFAPDGPEAWARLQELLQAGGWRPTGPTTDADAEVTLVHPDTSEAVRMVRSATLDGWRFEHAPLAELPDSQPLIAHLRAEVPHLSTAEVTARVERASTSAERGFWLRTLGAVAGGAAEVTATVADAIESADPEVCLSGMVAAVLSGPVPHRAAILELIERLDGPDGSEVDEDVAQLAEMIAYVHGWM